MVSCLMGDSTALASAIVRCCLKNIPAKRETENWKIFKRNDNEIGNRSRIIASSEVANFR